MRAWRFPPVKEVFQKGFVSHPRLCEAEDLAVVVVVEFRGAATIDAAARAALLEARALPCMTIAECQLRQADEGHGRRMRVFRRSAAAEGCQCCCRRGPSGQPEPIPFVLAQCQKTLRESGRSSSQNH